MSVHANPKTGVEPGDSRKWKAVRAECEILKTQAVGNFMIRIVVDLYTETLSSTG